ncbi:MAG: hypothetical protein HY868_16525 [Chloroflexi bacterium]|nr:hypothetical protein [Chloroflexota bacterium]
MDYFTVQEVGRQAESAFLQDHKENANRRRLVWTIDTAEQLVITTSEWLIEGGLIRSEEISFNTLQWLVDQIRSGTLLNTTLILAGRYEEGKRFFDEISKAVSQAQSPCEITDISIEPFSESDTQTYFQYLSQEWQQRAAQSSDYKKIASTMRELSAQEHTDVLWLYTAGQPVRLSLYADLIVDGRTIPAPLGDSPEQAHARVKTDDPVNKVTPELEQARWDIEHEFIRVLFAYPGSRSEILKALVRARPGLDADQLHFALHSPAGMTAEEWKPNPIKQEEIRNDLDGMRQLSIIKRRPGERLGLQDEIYRIYAEHMAVNPQDRQDETKARQRLYAKLKDWAEFTRRPLEEERKEFQTRDVERLQLQFTSPTKALSVQFPKITDREEERRIEIREKILDFETEEMHYTLLLSPYNFSNIAFDIGKNRWLAQDEEAEATAQAESWRVMSDPFTFKFADMKPRTAPQKRGETEEEVLRRAVRQDDVIRWIQRFVLRQDRQRAIDFSQRVESAIQEMAPNEKRSWSHTFARGERTCWREYARVMQGADILDFCRKLEDTAGELVQLATKDQNTPVFSERDECGFIGHPAEGRLRRTISLIYNFAGYGFVTIGRLGKAVKMYGLALKYARGTESKAHKAQVLTNLARAFSDMNRLRARRVCLDGLAMKKDIGAEVPIAYSYNTLALIDNRHLRQDLAWSEAATAVAYFRRVEESRGLGLALIQLGEALRRLANEARTAGRVFAEPAEIIYDQAELAVNEALKLFTESSAKGEPVRRVETLIELGCLHRDRILIDLDLSPDKWHLRYRDALHYLDEAIKLAHEIKNPRLELDARVNFAWANYYANDYAQAEKTLAAILENGLIPPDALIQENSKLPSAERDDLYVYTQASKIEHLRAQMSVGRFCQRTEEIEKDNPQAKKPELHQFVHQDSQAQEHLRTAAEAYVRGVGYAQLLSPRSFALTVIYDRLYEDAKKFNLTELNDLQEHIRNAREKYKTGEIKPVDLGDVESYLQSCFGTYD